MEKKERVVSDEEFKILIRDQFEYLFYTTNLAIDNDTKAALLPQTILGRAIEGHGLFDGARRPNITMEEIANNCGAPSEHIKAYRQEMIEDSLQCVDDLFDGKVDRFVNREGKPLYGVEFLKDMKLDINKDFFKGGAIVARMDMSEWRREALKRYPLTLDGKMFQIGFGKEHVLDLNRARELDVNNNTLFHDTHTLEKIQIYKDLGIIVSEKQLGKSGIENKFIRYERGLGITDDSAMISTGLHYGPDAMTFGFVVDATDTYTKFCNSSINGGYDEFMGRKIEARFKEKYGEDLLTPEETTNIIYLGAKNNVKMKKHFSSSHRRLVEYEEGQTDSTYINHLNFVKDGTVSNFKLGFSRARSSNFYKNIARRYKLAGKADMLKH